MVYRVLDSRSNGHGFDSQPDRGNNSGQVVHSKVLRSPVRVINYWCR